MAVVVQKMVSSDVAGILFTCNPTSGDPSKMIITSNYGLGEVRSTFFSYSYELIQTKLLFQSVVSGQADPDTIILKRDWEGKVSVESQSIGTKKIAIKMNADEDVEKIEVDGKNSSKCSLTQEQAILLGEIGVELERLFGDPRDIEWAFYNGKLYLLQSRPITTIKVWTHYEILHEFDAPILSKENLWTRANVGEVMQGALTVLSQSVLLLSLEKSLQLQTYGHYNEYKVRSLPMGLHHCFLDVLNVSFFVEINNY